MSNAGEALSISGWMGGAVLLIQQPVTCITSRDPLPTTKSKSPSGIQGWAWAENQGLSPVYRYAWALVSQSHGHLRCFHGE